MITLAQRLQTRLEEIVLLMDELLDASTIDYVPRRGERESERQDMIILGMPNGIWGRADDKQGQLQRRLLELWSPWVEQARLLFGEDTKTRQRRIREASASVEVWIQRSAQHGVPATIAEAKQVFRKMTAPLEDALRSLGDGEGRVLAVPDTNVLIRTPDITTYGSVLATTSYTVLLVAGVLGKLDGHKVNHKNQAVREKARKMSDRIKGWRNQGNLASGVRVQGDIWVQVEGREPDLARTLSWHRRTPTTAPPSKPSMATRARRFKLNDGFRQDILRPRGIRVNLDTPSGRREQQAKKARA